MAAGNVNVIRANPRTGNGGTTAPAGKPWAGGQGTGGTSAPKGSNKGPTTGLSGAQKSGWAVAPNKPVSGPTKPGATGGAAATQTPMPWDSAYELSVGGSNTKYNNSLINIAARRNLLKQEYGIDAGYNDYQANPYSRAALLEQTFQRANRASQTSYGSAGQLYAGSLQNQMSYNRDNRGREDNAMQSAYQSALQDLIDAETTAGDLRNSEIGDAGWKRIEAASNADLEPVPDGGKGKSKGNTGAGTYKVKGKKNGIIGLGGGKALGKGKK